MPLTSTIETRFNQPMSTPMPMKKLTLYFTPAAPGTPVSISQLYLRACYEPGKYNNCRLCNIYPLNVGTVIHKVIIPGTVPTTQPQTGSPSVRTTTEGISTVTNVNTQTPSTVIFPTATTVSEPATKPVTEPLTTTTESTTTVSDVNTQTPSTVVFPTATTVSEPATKPVTEPLTTIESTTTVSDVNTQTQSTIVFPGITTSGTEPPSTTTEAGSPSTTPAATTVGSPCSLAGELYEMCQCTLTCDDMRSGRDCSSWQPRAGKCCGCADGEVYGDDGSCVKKEECECTDETTGEKHQVRICVMFM